MEKIVDGKKYNTENAEMVSYFDNGCNGGDVHQYEEAVYRTKKSNWFLFQRGGPYSCMARHIGSNNITGSEDITPLTAEEAYKKLEEHNCTVAIGKYFPDKVEEA